MNYPQRNRGRHSFTKPALLLGLVFFVGFAVFSFFGDIVSKIVTPLWQGENTATAKLGFVGDFFKFKSSLIEENNTLKERVRSLELEAVSRASIPEVEGDLSTLLGRRPETERVVATALVVPPQTPYDTIVIDAGASDGVVIGSTASMAEGPILGVVSEVYSSSAKVNLYTSPGEKTAAVLERHRVPVTVEGVGGGNFRLMVSRETEVEIGDRILSADISSQLIAVVGEVHMETTDSFKDVFAKSPVNIFSLHYILINP